MLDAVDDTVRIRGELHLVLRGSDGEVKDERVIDNLVTTIGDRFYAERAAGVSGAPAAVTGMQLGSATTAAAKTGTGAGIVTLIANSLVALTGTPAGSTSGNARRVSYAADWPAGTATATINEVALVNQATGTQTVAPASATIARAVLATPVAKAAGDTLHIDWHHDVQGA